MRAFNKKRLTLVLLLPFILFSWWFACFGHSYVFGYMRHEAACVTDSECVDLSGWRSEEFYSVYKAPKLIFFQYDERIMLDDLLLTKEVEVVKFFLPNNKNFKTLGELKVDPYDRGRLSLLDSDEFQFNLDSGLDFNFIYKDKAFHEKSVFAFVQAKKLIQHWAHFDQAVFIFMLFFPCFFLAFSYAIFLVVKKLFIYVYSNE